jgi:hypothetical protein
MTVGELFHRHTNAELAEQLAFDEMGRQLAKDEQTSAAMNAAVERGINEMRERLKTRD